MTAFAARLERLDAAYLAARAEIVATVTCDDSSDDWPPPPAAIAGMIRAGVLVTPSEATASLKMSVQTIRRRCARDVAVKLGGRWYISPGRLVAASVVKKAVIDFAE